MKINIISIPAFLVAVTLLTSSASADTSEKKSVFPMDPAASCISAECHASMGTKKYSHPVGVDPKQCSRCHQITGEGEHRFNPIPAQVQSLCGECHSEEKSKPSDIQGKPPKVISVSDPDIKLHEPFSEGKCTICHDAHQSDYYRHLKIEYPAGPYARYSADTYKLCSTAECHKGIELSFTEPRTLSSTMFRNGNVNLHYKHVNKKKGRTCRTCHQHHGSKSPKLITSSFKFGKRMLSNDYTKTDSGGSCKTTCHREARYNRYSPFFNVIKVSPTPGVDATAEELKSSRERDITERKIKGTPLNE